MSNVWCPTENGFAERFVRTFKVVHIDYTEYNNFTEAVEQTTYWIEVDYMTERIHSSLNYLAPLEFEVLQNELLEPRIPQFKTPKKCPKKTSAVHSFLQLIIKIYY